MATKPPNYPAWATSSFALPISGLQNKVQPPGAWQLAGWDENEEPPCNYENWLKNNYYRWIQWFDSATVRCASYVVEASAGVYADWQADATCDGTSDQVEINAAIAAVSAAGGGIVLLSEGTFSVDGKIVHDASVQLRGMGQGTVIEVDSGAGTDFNMIEIDSEDNCAVINLKLDGNTGVHGKGHTAISIQGTSLAAVVERVWINDMDVAAGPTYGLGVEVTGTAARARICNCKISNCDGAGISISTTTNPSRTQIEGCHIWACSEGIELDDCYGVLTRDNKIYNSTSTGIRLGSATTAVQDCTVVGNEIHTVSSGEGIYARGSFCSISGNTIIGCVGYGIHPDELDTSTVSNNLLRNIDYVGIYVDACDYTTVGGNAIYDCSQDGGGTYSGIEIDGGTSCTVENNKFRNTTGTRSLHSIKTAPGGSGAVCIHGNDCRANSTGDEINNASGDATTLPRFAWDGAAHQMDGNALNYTNRVV